VLFYTIANQVYPSIWSYFTIEQFDWKLSTVGLSLAAYGLCSALVQVYVLKISINRYGEGNTARYGMIIAAISLLFIMVIDNSLYLFLGLPIVALGAVVGPSLQGMMADRVADNEQGELQGVLSSVTAIATIVSPLIMTNIFKHYTQADATFYLPGAPFGAAAVLAVIALIILYRSHHERKNQ
jgi:DHA1 family tetracycline resistance protein-like MFS transporter